ncbi:hypothetical protein BKA82DRAFT_991802 [Pisolithus tinctorius]|uniref:Uncharacterized protein n=1 Tax=Pisolithus tinctorius Marx 270 TaxID=870435 RepID=A0A0C3PZZ0_PISTI|nr:hypothetical protein BKA82DRAFT_991802 [Pisolithus tinctorius]KIO15104.1 hypothetical protein M404DRAFT_991802 [Pisolithus tinctorius Marx 270]
MLVVIVVQYRHVMDDSHMHVLSWYSCNPPSGCSSTSNSSSPYAWLSRLRRAKSVDSSRNDPHRSIVFLSSFSQEYSASSWRAAVLVKTCVDPLKVFLTRRKNLAGVTRFWRGLILDTPSFWSDIGLTRDSVLKFLMTQLKRSL